LASFRFLPAEFFDLLFERFEPGLTILRPGLRQVGEQNTAG
jgi:hypothetical protein